MNRKKYNEFGIRNISQPNTDAYYKEVIIFHKTERILTPREKSILNYSNKRKEAIKNPIKDINKFNEYRNRKGL